MKSIFTRLLLVLLCTGLFVPESFAIVPPAATASVEPDPATVKKALTEFRNLPRKERKARIKESRKAVKDYVKAERAAGRAPKASKVVQVIFAILVPPLGVYLHEGEINNRFWISLILTLLFFIPGMIYALVIVLGDE
ncbi:YqaE/Pmp3 family membrane protein [Flaviaesturariibacter amylovorans]|uniref:YqaE/Pmp3 family membrane protein n=1 Tax=Flaviaesturariibacter amylovorans TaxID=1084520 RepID=A0ABP8HGL0_9BACT